MPQSSWKRKPKVLRCRRSEIKIEMVQIILKIIRGVKQINQSMQTHMQNAIDARRKMQDAAKCTNKTDGKDKPPKEPTSKNLPAWTITFQEF